MNDGEVLISNVITLSEKVKKRLLKSWIFLIYVFFLLAHLGPWGRESERIIQGIDVPGIVLNAFVSFDFLWIVRFGIPWLSFLIYLIVKSLKLFKPKRKMNPYWTIAPLIAAGLAVIYETISFMLRNDFMRFWRPGIYWGYWLFLISLSLSIILEQKEYSKVNIAKEKTPFTRIWNKVLFILFIVFIVSIVVYLGSNLLATEFSEFNEAPDIHLEVQAVMDGDAVHPNEPILLIIENPHEYVINEIEITQRDQNVINYVMGMINGDDVSYDDYHFPSREVWDSVDLLGTEIDTFIEGSSTLEIPVTPVDQGYEESTEIRIRVSGKYETKNFLFTKVGQASGYVVVTLEP